ncbi:MAG: primosomal protein N' [Elusimicrobiaceae bacterium]|nr:primosomal protein N' [Elusimicrobiaceae bacterium]
MFSKVAFDVPLDRDFDYRIPDELVLTGGIVTQVTEISDAPSHITLKDIAALVDKKPLFGSDLFPLARFIKSRWGGPIGQILGALLPVEPYVKLEVSFPSFQLKVKTPDFQLTPSQQHALNTVCSFAAYEFHPVLLDGPAYSGKTETLLRLAGQILNGYGQILITVPDVAAARQFIAEAEDRFGVDNVFCWHSRMLQSKKRKYFSAISSGRPCVVIGTRSSVLLPFKNLRLAAMLDEGDDNYKQEENKPYYHAREVLFFRAKMHGALLLMVSATPSVELEQLARTGQILRLPFTTPVPGRQFVPQLKLTGKKGDKSRFLSDLLISQLTENLARKEMSLLILNRLGYAGAYACLNCGAYVRCKKCGAVLSHEKNPQTGDVLVCKKCGAKESMEQECPKCHNLVFKSRVGGTQKVVADLTKIFPQAKLLRLESDTLKTKKGQGFEALNALKNGKADIIVGTRVAAGALRGAKITLAALLDAELELSGPDYRTTEKFTRLLFDLRGHLSGVKSGRLIIQANDTESYDYGPVFSGNYKDAVDTEILLRESFNYPPFVHLFRVTLKSKDTDLLKAETARLRRLAAPLSLDVLGPVWCAKKTDTLKKQYLLFKTDEARRADLLALLDRFEPAKKVTVKLAADPYDFY